jgi:hypothetical protein
MADNVTVTTAADGDVSSIPTGTVIATDDCGATGHIQRVKLDIGGDGVSTPVTDLATGAKQDTANTALAAIETAVEGTLTVSGTVAVTGVATAANQTTELAHLAAIETAVEGTLTVGLPSGASTSAKQDTAQTALDAIKTAVEVLDNTVSGSELQVDVVAALPAGDNNIGNVDVVTLPSIPAGTNNIGDVDVLTLPALVAGTATIGVVMDERVSTSTRSSTPDSATNVTVLASNANRKAAFFFNDSDQIAYLALGATATTSDYTVKMAAGGFYEIPAPVYTGIVDCIWASNSTGSMRVTELT